jgi:hypothetical protein
VLELMKFNNPNTLTAPTYLEMLKNSWLQPAVRLLPLFGYFVLCFFMPGSCSCDLRGWLVQEPYQSLEVLRSCR